MTGARSRQTWSIADAVGREVDEVLLPGEVGVVRLAVDDDHGIVHDLADGGLIGIRVEVGPASFLLLPGDFPGFVFVLILRIHADVIVFGRVHVFPQLVGGEP